MKGITIIAFIAGAAIGAVATWQYTKKKYEKIAQEEIDSVKEVFARDFKKPDEVKEVNENTEEDSDVTFENTQEKPSIMEYAKVLSSEGYTNYSNSEKQTNDKPFYTAPVDAPYVIAPDNFGEFEDYTQIELTLFADGILADDNGNIVDEPEDIVGPNALTSFGEYEDDAVHVRNDARKCDYEIIQDTRRYADYLEDNPYKAEY